MKIKKLLARFYDLPNAYRVLDIMDGAGCDIERVNRPGLENSDNWIIVPKWYVSGKEAEDLRRIITYKRQYRKRSKIWENIFHQYRPSARILKFWPV